MPSIYCKRPEPVNPTTDIAENRSVGIIDYYEQLVDKVAP